MIYRTCNSRNNIIKKKHVNNEFIIILIKCQCFQYYVYLQLLRNNIIHAYFNLLISIMHFLEQLYSLNLIKFDMDNLFTNNKYLF